MPKCGGRFATGRVSSMTITYLSYLLIALVVIVPLAVHSMRMRLREQRAQASAEKGKLYSEGPKGMHPYIDTATCIGCGGCVDVCPEGDVLAVFAGKATIINGHKCIGHSLCAEVCPVGAIEMVRANPGTGADLPYLTPEYETNVENLFIVGELGGMALIKNAVKEGHECIQIVAARVASMKNAASPDEVHDVCVVGAGPAGISASLTAIENKLSYITIEQDEIGGTVAKYPRQKLVMTSPVHFPMYGKFRKLELSKEDLLTFWHTVAHRADFKVRTSERVEGIKKDQDGIFTVTTPKSQYRSRTVVLALGRRGTPRKLGVKGEDLPKVMYSLIEADHYKHAKILVVGGGDSAVEAAMGLAYQEGNVVTLSYRKDRFSRIKERNAQRIEECIRRGKVKVAFNSMPVEIKPESVVLDAGGTLQEIPNDYAWVFAGGIAPNEFLQKIGIEFGEQDTTLKAGTEARNAAHPVLVS